MMRLPDGLSRETLEILREGWLVVRRKLTTKTSSVLE